MALGHPRTGEPLGDNHSNRKRLMDYGFPHRVGQESRVLGFAETPTADYHGIVSADRMTDDAVFSTSVFKNTNKSINRLDETDLTPRPGRKYKTAKRALQAGDLIVTADERRESGRMPQRPKSTGGYAIDQAEFDEFNRQFQHSGVYSEPQDLEKMYRYYKAQGHTFSPNK